MLKFLKRIIANVGDSISCLLFTCFCTVAMFIGGIALTVLSLTDFREEAVYPQFRRAMVDA